MHRLASTIPVTRVSKIIVASVLVLTVFAGVLALVNDQRHQQLVAQSLKLIQDGRMPEMQMIKDEIFKYISGNLGDLERVLDSSRNETVLSALVRDPKISAPVRQLLGYYNSAYVCLTRQACDPTTLCDVLVPEIREFDRVVDGGAYANRRAALPTDADRLTESCGRLSGDARQSASPR